MVSIKPFLKDVLPNLNDELKILLNKDEKFDLAEKVDSLRIFEKCNCKENSCASFYTAPKPNGSFGKGHENLILNAEYGMLVLDVVNNEIKFVEILNRPEYKKLIETI